MALNLSVFTHSTKYNASSSCIIKKKQFRFRCKRTKKSWCCFAWHCFCCSCSYQNVDIVFVLSAAAYISAVCRIRVTTAQVMIFLYFLHCSRIRIDSIVSVGACVVHMLIVVPCCSYSHTNDDTKSNKDMQKKTVKSYVNRLWKFSIRHSSGPDSET